MKLSLSRRPARRRAVAGAAAIGLAAALTAVSLSASSAYAAPAKAADTAASHQTAAAKPVIVLERFFIALAVPELLGDLGARAPLLVVDDLHWADSDSRDVILFAARRIEAEHAVMLLAARPVQAGVAPWEQAADWLVLDALNGAAARTLLRGRYPWLTTTDERAVLASAAGNPLAHRAAARARLGQGRGTRPGHTRPANRPA
jgi:hypothetical protein